MNPFEQYAHHAERYKKLMEAPEVTRATTEAMKEWRMCMLEERMAMNKAASRLTIDQKHKLGIHPSQRELK